MLRVRPRRTNVTEGGQGQERPPRRRAVQSARAPALGERGRRPEPDDHAGRDGGGEGQRGHARPVVAARASPNGEEGNHAGRGPGHRAVVESDPVMSHLGGGPIWAGAAVDTLRRPGACFSMNASSVIGGRPPSFSTRSLVPAKMPFWWSIATSLRCWNRKSLPRPASFLAPACRPCRTPRSRPACIRRACPSTRPRTWAVSA